MNKIICVLICFVTVRRISAHPVEDIYETTTTEAVTNVTISAYAFQRTQLEKFRTVVADLLDDEYEKSDEYLLGFLKSKNWKIFSAQQMLKIAKKWKETHKIKELAKSNFSQEMLTHFPVKLEGYDKMECPITEVHFGSWDVADYILKQEFTRDGVKNFILHVWQLLAKVEYRNRKNFPKCHQTFGIATLRNFNASHFSEINSISSFIRMLTTLNNYFPSVLLAGHCVEVPDNFKPLEELMKNNLNPEIYKIITVHYGQNWKEDLHNIVEINQLSI